MDPSLALTLFILSPFAVLFLFIFACKFAGFLLLKSIDLIFGTRLWKGIW